MISIFDMTKKHAGKEGEADVEGQWIGTRIFTQGVIRQMFLKKRSKEERTELLRKRINSYGANDAQMAKSTLSVYRKYQIVSVVGTHSIVFCELD